MTLALCGTFWGMSDSPSSLSRSNIPLKSTSKDKRANSSALARISCSSVMLNLSEGMKRTFIEKERDNDSRN